MMTEIEKLKDIQQRFNQNKMSLIQGNNLKYWMEFGQNKEKKLQQISKIKQLLNLPIDIVAEELIQLQNLYLRNMENTEIQKKKTKTQLDRAYQSVKRQNKNGNGQNDQNLSLFQNRCQINTLNTQQAKKYSQMNYKSDVQKVDVAYARAHQFLGQIYNLIARSSQIDPKNPQSQRVIKEVLLWRDYYINIQNIRKEIRKVIPLLFLVYFVILLSTSSFQPKTTQKSVNGTGNFGTSPEINNLRTEDYDDSDYLKSIIKGLQQNESILAIIWRWVIIVTVSSISLDLLITMLVYRIYIRILVFIRWFGYLCKCIC